MTAADPFLATKVSGPAPLPLPPAGTAAPFTWTECVLSTRRCTTAACRYGVCAPSLLQSAQDGAAGQPDPTTGCAGGGTGARAVLSANPPTPFPPLVH